ncbi:MAG: SigF/SigG family RNA polymerase sporulation sigma factor [Eubacteriales bacterium]|nr:SigF/SigG family RNA polymerase sporulation sigma factor [Eubacteriales bacterium]
MYHTKELIVKAHGGDDKAREQLVLQNMGLVWSIVKRFAGRGYEQEDLFQIGSIGLMKAIDKFDVSFDVCFSTYAVPMIAGEIKRFLRDDGMIKVSRTLKENAVKSARAIEELRKEKSGEPTIEEVAQKTGLDVCDIVMSFEASADVESLYKTIYQGDGSEILLIDKIEENKNENDALVDSLVVHDVLDKLPENDRKLIVMRYFDEKTQNEIAKTLGISQVQVSRMEKKILARLKRQLD